MKPTFADILKFLLAALICSACSSDPVPEVIDPDPEVPADVYLNLSVGVMTQMADPASRADNNTYFEGPESKYERIHTFRIIIVRGERTTDIPYIPSADGIIEHNRLYANYSSDGVDFHDNMVFKVAGGEKKKIYLIANEQYLKDKYTIDFDAYKPGIKYNGSDFETRTLDANPDGVLFDNTPSSQHPYFIPMSESYEIDVPAPQSSAQYEIARNLFITRAAVKFSFVINTADAATVDRGLVIKDIVINGMSNSEYFFPRAEYDPDKNSESTNYLEGRYVEKYAVPDAANELKEFSYSVNIPIHYYDAENVENQPGQDPNIARGLLYAPAIYFPESAIPANNGKYTVGITIGHPDNADNDLVFRPIELQNLPSLPRNTHVVINITLKELSGIEASVKLVPYIGVTLPYTFGFEELIKWTRPVNPDIQ